MILLVSWRTLILVSKNFGGHGCVSSPKVGSQALEDTQVEIPSGLAAISFLST